jgi:hypothetical protein
MTIPTFDLWGALRSFSSDRRKPVHARWRQLKNLSHVIANHPNPFPYWDYLKTVLVQEMSDGSPSFELLGSKLTLHSHCRGPGLEWGQSDPINRREEAWFAGPAGSLSLRDAKQGPQGWEVEGRLAHQGLNWGVAWSVVLVVSPTDRPESQFRLPLEAGFLDSDLSWGDDALVSMWRGALYQEEKMSRIAMQTREVREHVQSLGIQFYPDWAQDWAALIFAPSPTEFGLQRGEALALRSLYSAAQRYIASRQTGMTFPGQESPFSRVVKGLFQERYPLAKKWGEEVGPARALLMEQALQSFTEADRRGREGLEDLMLSRPRNWGSDESQPFVTLIGAPFPPASE